MGITILFNIGDFCGLFRVVVQFDCGVIRMDQLYKEIKSSLELLRTQIIAGAKVAEMVKLVDSISTKHQQLEKRVYTLEMELANSNRDISPEQLIVHPLHTHIQQRST